MSDPIKHLKRLLRDASVSKIEISAAPPFVKLVFDTAELEGLLHSQALISDLVARHFIRPSVYWIDLEQEIHSEVDNSLKNAEDGLDQIARELSNKSDPAMIGFGKFVRSWATATALVRGQLAHNIKQIAEEKDSVLGYDSAGEDRRTALRDALIELRQSVYPTVIMLVAFLADDDPTKSKAQELLDKGLNIVADAKLQREISPEVDEAN